MKYELKHVEGNQHILVVDGFEIASVYTYKDDCTVEVKKLIDDAEIGRATEKAFIYFSMGQPSDNGTIEFDILDVESLLDWAKED